MNSRHADILWIEADPVSGGSESQVEIPQKGGAFFGGSDDPTLGEELRIAIEYAGHEFEPKKMNFRPSKDTKLNHMWRINLPTATQGLGGYAGKVLVFKRTERGGVYHLDIIEIGSPILEKLTERTGNQDRIDTTRKDDSTRTGGYFSK